MGITGFYWVLLLFIVFFCILLHFIASYRIALFSYRVILFFWFSLVLICFYRSVSKVLNCFLCNFTGFTFARHHGKVQYLLDLFSVAMVKR